MLSPMPLAISMGVGSQSTPYVMPAVENINGQAITLANKHKGVKSAADMKGFKFGVPFDYSMHNFLLRYVLAEAGVDPDKDVQIRKAIASAIAPRNFLNQPVEVLEQILTGVYPDGLGNTKTVPDRIDFDPFPYHSMAVWILTQMKRWGYLKQDVDYKKVAADVFLATACRDALKGLGKKAPESASVKHTFVLGKAKVFDPDKAAEYLSSFPIKRA
jgi:ABC-type nitrate/sulfonate/bicarbonate transport system substrate-binding protein